MNANRHSAEFEDLPGDAARRGEDNEHRVTQALERYQDSVIPGLPPRKERRLVREHLTAELRLGFEHRRAALGMVLETRLQSIREACNHLLVTGKTHLRRQRIEYFGEIYHQLEERLSRLADDYLKETDARFSRLETIKSDHLRRCEQQRLEKSADTFLSTLDALMDEFRSIVREHVERQDQRLGS